MSRARAARTAVVIASVGDGATVRASLAAFLAEMSVDDEIVLVDASSGRIADRVAGDFPRVLFLRRPPCSLVPELWAAGLKAASTPLVAFSTAQMTPRRGWLTALRDRLEATGAAGVGGSIAPAAELSTTDRALYLLRYANYLPPVPSSARFDPPGDNALYRRDRLLELEGEWRRGFWEVEIHKLLRARGETLACAPTAVVEFLGGTALSSAMRHRLSHARQFGSGRTCGRSWGHRLARSATFPAVPAVLLSRILHSLRLRNAPVKPWLSALPTLMVLLSVWSVGEALGACLGAPARHLDPV